MLSNSVEQKWHDLRARFERDFISKPILWLAAVLVAGFLAFYFDSTKAPVANARVAEDVESAATYIPEGFVLVPIEISNFESLDSLLGKHGVVDLYLPADEFRKKPQKIAERVKILRAPLNPSHFAVLVSEEDSPRLATQPGPFIVVVQPLNSANSQTGTRFVGSSLESVGAKGRSVRGMRKSRIEVEGVIND